MSTPRRFAVCGVSWSNIWRRRASSNSTRFSRNDWGSCCSRWGDVSQSLMCCRNFDRRRFTTPHHHFQDFAENVSENACPQIKFYEAVSVTFPTFSHLSRFFDCRRFALDTTVRKSGLFALQTTFPTCDTPAWESSQNFDWRRFVSAHHAYFADQRVREDGNAGGAAG